MVFIPGLGADKRLFHPQRKAFPHSMAPDWIAPLEKETLAHYARRWVKRLRLKPGCILVGVSFGGMIAQEMARWVNPGAVVLVGSCRSPASIPFPLRMAGSLPTWPRLSKWFCGILPEISGHFLGAKTPDQRDLLIRMFLDTPDAFAKWTVAAIRGWKGCGLDGTRVFHIHGEKDRLIPVRKVQPDSVIRGGGHLINLSHPTEVNAFIRRRLRK